MEKRPTSASLWSIKNIVIRIFTYPLGICVLFLGTSAICNAHKTKCIFAGIMTMTVVLMYLYTDVKRLMNEKKQGRA